jgi:hypothetical protein
LVVKGVLLVVKAVAAAAAAAATFFFISSDGGGSSCNSVSCNDAGASGAVALKAPCALKHSSAVVGWTHEVQASEILHLMVVIVIMIVIVVAVAISVSEKERGSKWSCHKAGG